MHLSIFPIIVLNKKHDFPNYEQFMTKFEKIKAHILTKKWPNFDHLPLTPVHKFEAKICRWN